MSAELGVMFGLTAMPFILYKLLEEFQESERMETEAFLVISTMFPVSMMYTGYGIADANSLSNAANAYLVALLVTVVFFLYLLIELVRMYRAQTREDNEFGYFNQG